MEETYLKPYIFTRHKLPLHALLIQNQPWFCARDLSRLLHIHLNERMPRKLDHDQYQTRKTLIHNQIENALLISESGIYALLVYHYCPEYRSLREWLTHQVIPTLRDAQHPTTSERPHLSLLSWPNMTLSLLHWNNQPWIRLQDVPHMVTEREQANRTVVNSWWRKALQLI
jgi:prophage antirepressor-like protein